MSCPSAWLHPRFQGQEPPTKPGRFSGAGIYACTDTGGACTQRGLVAPTAWNDTDHKPYALRDTNSNAFSKAGCALSVVRSGASLRLVSTPGCTGAVSLARQDPADADCAVLSGYPTGVPCPFGKFDQAGTFTPTESGGPWFNPTSNQAACTLVTYNAREHPALATNGQIVISYNVHRTPGTVDEEDPCLASGAPHVLRSAANYRPRFFVFGTRD